MLNRLIPYVIPRETIQLGTCGPFDSYARRGAGCICGIGTVG